MNIKFKCPGVAEAHGVETVKTVAPGKLPQFQVPVSLGCCANLESDNGMAIPNVPNKHQAQVGCHQEQLGAHLARAGWGILPNQPGGAALLMDALQPLAVKDQPI